MMPKKKNYWSDEGEEGGGGCEAFSTNQEEVLHWGGEGGMDQWWSNKWIFWVIFHPGKAQKAQESCICPKGRE